MADWYYAKDHQMGPVTEERLRQMIARGEVAMTDLVWTQGMADWVPAGNVPLLLPPRTVSVSPYITPLPGGAADPYGQQPYQEQVGYYTPGVVYAGFWLRALAYIIDSVVLCIGVVILTVPMVVVLDGRASDEVLGCMWMLLVAGGVVLYSAGMESSRFQGTVGKIALGLKVTTLTGERISFARGLGRFFAEGLSGIFSIGYLMTAFTDRKQSLHDLICNTVVVHSR